MDDHDAYCSKWAYIPMTNSLTHWLKTCSWFIHRGHEPLNGIQVGKAPNFADTAFLVKCLGSFLSNTKAPLQKQHLMILRRLIFRCVRSFGKSWKFEQFVASNKTWSPQQIWKGCSTTSAETATDDAYFLTSLDKPVGWFFLEWVAWVECPYQTWTWRDIINRLQLMASNRWGI